MSEMRTGVLSIVRRGLRAGWSRSQRLLGRGRPPRVEKDYASHLPVLLGLARIFDLRSVLEFGCGYFSTLAFLDRSAFPALTTLCSFESDAAWLARVEELVGSDLRLQTRLVGEPMETVLGELSPCAYDLVFVDHSTDGAKRAATIRALAGWCADSSLVVMHDFEAELYQKSASAFPQRFEFRALNPSTGLAWKRTSVDRQRLKFLNHAIRRHSKRLAPDDRAGWVGVFDSTPGLTRNKSYNPAILVNQNT